MRVILSLLLLLTVFAPLSFAQQTSYENAVKAYVKKDFKSAVSLLQETIKENPTAKAYYLLGYAHYKLHQHEEAAGYFKEAYLLEPDFKPEILQKELK